MDTSTCARPRRARAGASTTSRSARPRASWSPRTEQGTIGAVNERLAMAHLYFVVEADASDALLDAALAGGVDLLQLRDKHCGDDELLRAAERFRSACDRHGALFVLNDRPELAA